MRVLVIAPHPDDETLGCGGTLLKHVAAGDSVGPLISSRGANDTSNKSQPHTASQRDFV
jgi:LmbE family N-acetylglucosaminyl deacetylase